MNRTRSLGILAVRSAAPRRVSGLSLHTSAIALRVGPPASRSRPNSDASRTSRLSNKLKLKRLPRLPDLTSKKLLSLAEAQAALIHELNTWTKLDSTGIHIRALGIPQKEAEEWLVEFAKVARDELTTLDINEPQPEDDSAHWNLDRIADNMTEDRKVGLQSAYLNRFLYFVISQLESTGSSPELLASLRAIRETTDLRNQIEWYPHARSIRRKIIMHVGPTNSGKTYNALQALAAAPSGVYAGPLRLLAHEVWQRINRGSVTPKQPPLGETPAEIEGVVDLDDAAPISITTESPTDPQVAVKSVPTKPSPPAVYQGRPCNLVTGEEQRVVSPTATLLACTVEMIPKHLFWDVGVIDEIQMIADPTRGGAWTSAVLGLAARELHLCGEDTVVDLIRSLCAMTGDELIINRYERLTPLEVAPHSLKGRLDNIEPGDCVVTFSRSQIFETKRHIEEATGLRCAVVYGRLPPEIRSEQAQLFNTEESGYDVIVASDSVGMGLNLKIKRVVFMRTEKWAGKTMMPLSIPLIKQIGGRAGRFGVHKSNTKHHEITNTSMADIAASQPPGIVTALHTPSLEHVRKAMAMPNPKVTQARVDIANVNIEVLARALPPRTGVTDLLDTMRLLALLPSNMKLCLPTFNSPTTTSEPPPIITSDSPAPILPRVEDISSEIDAITQSLPLPERLIFAIAPVRWRDPYSKAAALVYFRAYEHNNQVRVREDIRGLGLVEALEQVQKLMKLSRGSTPPKVTKKSPAWPTDMSVADLEEFTLQRLESLHSTLVVYLWLSYRLPLGFYQAYETAHLKVEVERGIEWCLKQIKARKAVGRQRRREEALLDRLSAPPEEQNFKPEKKIEYLTRDAIERWKRQGSTSDAWHQLLKNNRLNQAAG
ncbi:ATP-dependent RNA helicase SUV3L, mitochondrial [Ceratobasidium sp. AG-Ba]|nr:ATP-dependent RNA helicase SUV3L, mitochondrial [Ceratobasidium sp. AG-Ba]